MSVTNYDVMQAFAYIVTPLTDNLSANFAVGAGAQQQGLKLVGEMNRITKAVANGAVVLPSVGSGEASSLLVVVNDSGQSITVGAWAGGSGAAEQLNGVTTTSSFGAGVLAIPSGSSGIFIRSGSPFGIGGVGTAAQVNWHGIVVT